MKLIMLDRDGVINYDSLQYIKSPDEWIPAPGSLEAIARLNQAGYKVAVATNQSGIARGLYTEKTLTAIHQKMLTMLAALGGHIDKIVYCRHHPDEGCICRKPRVGLLLQIANFFNCSLTNIIYVGDKWTDVEVALAVNAKPTLVEATMIQPSTMNLAELAHEHAIPYYANLAGVVDNLV